MSEKLEKFIVSDQQITELNLKEDKETFQSCIRELNDRIDYIYSPEFNKLCLSAKKLNY